MDLQPATALLCRPDGTVIEVLHDDLGLAAEFAPGTSFTSVVEPDSVENAVRLLRGVRRHKLALDFKVGIKSGDTVLQLFLFGYRTQRGIYLIAAKESLSRESLFYELIRLREKNVAVLPAEGPVRKPEFDPSRDALLALTAHDLRNHLNGILAASQYLAADAAPLLEPDHQAVLRSIESSGRAMLRTIDDLMEASAMETTDLPLDLQALDVQALIERNLPGHRLQANRKKILLEFVPVPAVPVILADPIRINRALDLLISNTIEFSSPGSKIGISVTAQDPRLIIALTAGNTIFDVGLLRSVFDLGQSTIKGMRAATALACRLASRIVEQHRGTLKVDATEEGGFVITVALWVVEKAPARTLDSGGPL